MIKLVRSILPIVILAACFSIQAQSNSTESTETTSDLSSGLAAVHQQMMELSEDKTCANDDDCATVGFGQLACGGPASYVIYSKQLSKDSQQTLSNLSVQSEKLAIQLNEQRSMASICAIVPPPVVTCQAKQCVQAQAKEVRDFSLQ